MIVPVLGMLRARLSPSYALLQRLTNQITHIPAFALGG